MHIVVLIKQVPEMDKVRFDTEKGVIDRQSAGVEINPFDLNALEAAVRIKEEAGGTVTALSMGPPRAEDVLREAVARGADRGILLTDRRFGGSDTFATSSTLAAAVGKIGARLDCDLVIAGEMTVDGDTAQVGPQTAEFLGIPHIAYVSSISAIQPDYIEVLADVWRGRYLKRLYLPALITVTKDINSPRLPSFKAKAAARKAEITRWGAEALEEELSALGIGIEKLGIKGSPTTVRSIVIPPAVKREGKIFRGNLEEALQTVREVCREKHLLGNQ
ncbi:MAG: electron transfer flavoprotein subunit beta/FixA family protein [Sediminispirochaetaceae bacterium]